MSRAGTFPTDGGRRNPALCHPVIENLECLIHEGDDYLCVKLAGSQSAKSNTATKVPCSAKSRHSRIPVNEWGKAQMKAYSRWG